ncbi:MAG: tripartite tricarboxylate transporter TctB family protein [Rhodobacteraceae bacterium]|nr:tripartite tricarboxylate transporter TctB family protein [Paracoccaceae bacterium]
MKRVELILVLLLAAFAASLVAGATGMNYSDQYSFGPGFVPLNAGVLLLLCCGLQAVRVTKRQSEPREEGDAPDVKGLLLAGVIVAGGILAMSLGSVMLPIAGIVFLISWLVTRHSLAMSLLVSAATTGVIYLIFSIWLNLPIT